MSLYEDIKPISWSSNGFYSKNYDYEYKIWDVINELSSELFPQLAPIAYRRFIGEYFIYLYVFSLDGKLYKHGICHLDSIYDYSTGIEKIRPFEYILNIKLYPTVREFLERNRYEI